MLIRRALLAPIALVSLTAVLADSPVTFDERERQTIFSLSPLPPPPLDATNRVDGNPQAIALGKRLFSDTRLSGSGEFSCATCHDAARGWADGKEVAVAAGVGVRNTPSLWNAAHNRWYFWDGRTDSLWSQALKPIESAVELDGSRLQVARVIHDDLALRSGYEALFGDLPAALADAQRFPPTGGPQADDEERQLNWWRMNPEDRAAVTDIFVNVGKAIAAYEATILSKPAPFDRFVAQLKEGTRPAAISAAAQRGLKTFIGAGNCVLCHSGPNFTNKEFHDIRVPARSAAGVIDTGRGGGVPRLLEDEFVAAGPHSDDAEGTRAMHLLYLDFEGGFAGHFRTPSLRNVAQTAPYMHAGQYRTLEQVVLHYSRLADAVEPAEPEHTELLIRPFPLDEREIDDLIAFLESLTGG
jgi:cytochrome c peroxidase